MEPLFTILNTTSLQSILVHYELKDIGINSYTKTKKTMKSLNILA